MGVSEILRNILNVITLIGIIFAVYLYFRKPQEKSEKVDAVMYTQIDALQKCTLGLSDKLEKVFENHLPHIQDSTSKIENRLTKIETILEERLPKNNLKG